MPKQLKDSGKQFALCITGALNKTAGSKVNHLSGSGEKKAMKAKQSFNAHVQSEHAES